MQFSKVQSFAQRMQSRAIVESVKEGKKIDNSWPHCYLLAICMNSQFDYEEDFDRYAETFVQRSNFPGRVLQNNRIHIRVYNLDRFEKIHPNFVFFNDTDKYKHQWLNFFLNCVHKTSIPTDALPEIKEAFEKMKYAEGRTELFEAKALIDHEDTMWNEGKVEGIKIGKKNSIHDAKEEQLREIKSKQLIQIKRFIEQNMTNEEINEMNALYSTDEVKKMRIFLKDHTDCSIEKLAEFFSKIDI